MNTSGVAPHFLGHGVAQRLADGHGHHLGTLGHLRVGLGGDFGGGGRFRRMDLRFAFANGSARFLDFLGDIGRSRGCFRRRCDGRLTRFGICRFGIGGAFAVGQNGGDRCVDRDVLGAFGDQYLAEGPLIGGLDFHGGLVGLDLGDDVA